MRRVGLAGVAAFCVFAACGAPEGDETASGTETPAPAAAASSATADAEAIRGHMAYLASDDLKGREAGTPGYDQAVDYVVAEFEKLGLTPAGDDGGYRQAVPLRRAFRDPDGVSMEVRGPDDEAIPFEANTDYVVFSSTKDAESEVTGEAVFVGFGVVAPEEGRDDYGDLDPQGKILVRLAGTPNGLQSEERAYYGAQVARHASERGAVGLIALETPATRAIYPFGRLVGERRADESDMTWITSEGEPFTRAPNLKVGALVSMEGAQKLFEGLDRSWDEIIDAASSETSPTPAFELPYTITLKQRSTLDEIESANVAGMIEGSDPELRDEVIVLTAHLDHIGVSKTFEEDTINNGALDNAAGVATLLEAARMMSEGPAPRRSVLFLAVTAEEKGLLGAQYFAENPTLPADRIVGNVNLDMPVLTYDFTDVIVFGGARSTINDAITEAAGEMGIAIGEDPFPEQGIFTRSDHYRFVEAGVPSVMLSTGFANGGDAAWAEHFAQNYHRPSDDMDNNLNFEAAAKFAELKARIATTMANADERPLWRKDDFFARQFNGPQEE